MIREKTVQELKKMRDEKANFFLLDVREQSEFDEYNIGGHLIPSKDLPNRMSELDPNQEIIVHCKGGGRSSRAVDFLQQNGFKNVFNLKGGVTAWKNEIDI